MEIQVEPKKEYHINLVLTEREARVLRVVIGSVLGCPTGPRGICDYIHDALEHAGVQYTASLNVGKLLDRFREAGDAVKSLTVVETREVTCDAGYRFTTDEEHRQFSISQVVPADWEWFCVGRWMKGGPWVYDPKFRHYYRIACVKLPQDYALMEDPDFFMRPGVDIAIPASKGHWHTVHRPLSVQFWLDHGYFVATPVLPDVPAGFRIANPHKDKDREFTEWGCAKPGNTSWEMELCPNACPNWVTGTIYIVKDAPARVTFDDEGYAQKFTNITREEVAGKTFRLEEV